METLQKSSLTIYLRLQEHDGRQRMFAEFPYHGELVRLSAGASGKSSGISTRPTRYIKYLKKKQTDMPLWTPVN